ncbi:MarR family transcriptional regulator [Aliiroseovarius sp. PrR006]|uniref:MarR family transcriptional regulator n=1 Tax=Aliiroseovarius sp. PrR006 TaxID=2706883 RepID=UPI0013D1AA32|nr:MarR family transcriptional regulator [Aliiroseovarius sp. PrR006]NDW51899.1 MarR family transcriptional regulator [Aliiroseovarius sp. PrR006]
MSKTPTHIAVLTGDIIGSTQMSPEDLERAFDALSASAEVQAEWHGEDLHFTRQRGDGWQVRLARPELALRSALAFRAALRCEGKEFSTFMAVATGPATPIMPGMDLNWASDEAFIESGRRLDQIKSNPLTTQIAHTDIKALGATFVLADHISQSWTPAQAAAILPMLALGNSPNYSKVARALGKSRQAVTKALEGAGYDSIWVALAYIENEEAKDD